MSNESLAAPGAALRAPTATASSVTTSRLSVTVSACTAVGAAACAAAVLACVGAVSSWFSFSLLGVTAHISGMNSHLDGRYALALGVAGFGLGALVAFLPRRGWVHAVAVVLLALVGVVGMDMLWHQYSRLTNTATTLGRTTGLSPFAKYFDVHAGAGWGFWLDAACFGGFVIAAVAAAIVRRFR